jgi:hypothetical protein
MMILRWESSSGNYRTPSSCPSCAQFLAAAKTISFFLAFFFGGENTAMQLQCNYARPYSGGCVWRSTFASGVRYR